MYEGQSLIDKNISANLNLAGNAFQYDAEHCGQFKVGTTYVGT